MTNEIRGTAKYVSIVKGWSEFLQARAANIPHLTGKDPFQDCCHEIGERAAIHVASKKTIAFRLQS